MLQQKQGMPEEDELVLCKITNIHYHSVFAKLLEYENKTGMIHISEVSPGRIRNIRDYVREGKVVVCKVLRIHEDKGHIDLSLRRVNETQRRLKQNAIKQEQLAENIVKQVAAKHKKDVLPFYKQLTKKLLDEEHERLYDVFEEVTKGERDLQELPKTVAQDLVKLIQQRIKPPEVSLKGEFSIRSYAPDGLSIVQGALQAGEEAANVTIRSKGAGKYAFVVKAENYKDGEAILDDVKSAVLKYLDAHEAEGEFAKVE